MGGREELKMKPPNRASANAGRASCDEPDALGPARLRYAMEGTCDS
jgi:hypothetical protein